MFFLLALVWGGPAHAQQFPELTGRVVDAAGLLSPEEEKALGAQSEALELEAGPQFVIVTVPDLQGHPVDAYSLRLARHWGLGSKERSDGLMLLVAPAERKARIEVGTGLESRVTNRFAAQVMREQLIPRFQDCDYFAGIQAGSAALIARLRSGRSDAPTSEKEAAR